MASRASSCCWRWPSRRSARSGHELPVYPSYYPHEIEIATVTPERAGPLLLDGKIHAYVGSAPRFAAAPPDTIQSVESLGSLVTVRVNPISPHAQRGSVRLRRRARGCARDRGERCRRHPASLSGHAAARRLSRSMSISPRASPQACWIATQAAPAIEEPESEGDRHRNAPAARRRRAGFMGCGNRGVRRRRHSSTRRWPRSTAGSARRN